MAARFWIGGGTNTNWNASPTTNWSATSGGAVRVAAPTASDDVTFDGAGANGNTASVVSANNSCLSLTFTSGYTNTITINTTITLTVAGNFTDNTAHSWTVSGSGALSISAASTITSNGKIFPGNVGFGGSNTKTLVGDWTITGTLNCANTTTTINKTTAEVLSCGGFTVTGNTAGTINITITSGLWSGSGTNTISGIIKIDGGTGFSSATIHKNGGTVQYVSGTFNPNASTFSVDGSLTLDTNGMSFTNVAVSVTSTITLNSLLTIIGSLTVQNAISPTFAGTAGWTIGTFNGVWSSTGGTVTLVNGVSYIITTSFSCPNSRTGQITFTSDDATLKAILTLNNGASSSVLANFTRINASNGRAIYTFNGTVTSCDNIFSFTDALPPAKVGMFKSAASY